MRQYLLRRCAAMVPVLLGVVTVVFLALRLVPGDPAVALAGEKASAAQIEQMREALGLKRPLPVQYVEFVGHMLTFQLGRSIRTGGDIAAELAENFAPTIELSAAALLIAVAVGLPSGVVAAVRRRTLLEQIARSGDTAGRPDSSGHASPGRDGVKGGGVGAGVDSQAVEHAVLRAEVDANQGLRSVDAGDGNGRGLCRVGGIEGEQIGPAQGEGDRGRQPILQM